MKIIFFGPPGSGKGTQAKLIAEKHNILHLSTGDILRQKLNDGDKLSEELKKTMSSGNLVSDNLLNQIIAKKLKTQDCLKGYILDGYPRTLTQSEFFLSFLKINNTPIDFIFDFKIDFQIVEERIIRRFKEEKRSDDNLDVVKTRLNMYMQETYPVSQSYSKEFAKNYYVIDAAHEVSQIQMELMKIIKKGEK